MFHAAVDAEAKTISPLLAGCSGSTTITGVSSAGVRISWHAFGDEPPTNDLDGADEMARRRCNGDGFGIGVYGPGSEITRSQIADLVHRKILSLSKDKVLEPH